MARRKPDMTTGKSSRVKPVSRVLSPQQKKLAGARYVIRRAEAAAAAEALRGGGGGFPVGFPEAQGAGDARGAAGETREVVANGRLGRSGNSQSVRLTKEVLEAAGLEKGAEITVSASEGKVVIEPAVSPDARDLSAQTRASAQRMAVRYARTFDLLRDA